MKVFLVLLVSLVACGARGEHTDFYSVSAGQNVTVKCFFYEPANQTITFFFCKNDCNSKENILVDSDRAGGRNDRYSIKRGTSVDFYMFVTIEKTRSSDSGTYVCSKGKKNGKQEKIREFVLSVAAGRRHFHWLLLSPVALVMTSVLVLRGCRKNEEQTDENPIVESRHSRTDFQTELYENMSEVSESADFTYQSLCVETMDPNQVYSTV
ncbi:uncharacterized protein LOC129409795 [Boleophthalmus pectinirostris]|uniref:uncharacterized protein LOC129409795 n=1 Tax=Boleophthalmus pectinirostris TaxID=150288 RepID=UPI00242AEBAC|nr:uncharacterized protein LOC129409795 [Boleophthalmus pectinirostris]